MCLKKFPHPTFSIDEILAHRNRKGLNPSFQNPKNFESERKKIILLYYLLNHTSKIKASSSKNTWKKQKKSAKNKNAKPENC